MIIFGIIKNGKVIKADKIELGNDYIEIPLEKSKGEIEDYDRR